MVSSSIHQNGFRGQDLHFEMLDPDAVHLVRLFRHDGGDWQPPQEQYRNLRVDPPSGSKAEFAVLYAANTLPAAAMECGILRADHLDRYVWDADLAKQYKVVRYTYQTAAIFVPLDGRNREVMGLAGGQRRFMGYDPYQQASLRLFKRYGQTVHGLCWESFHRDQPGRVYAIWHHRKDAMGLRIDSPQPYVMLADDPKWLEMLESYPDIQQIRSLPPTH
ncbi:MAG: RES domain-containing protein [Burkholderiaceae bacterium]